MELRVVALDHVSGPSAGSAAWAVLQGTHHGNPNRRLKSNHEQPATLALDVRSAQKPAFLHPNWKHNDPKAVPIVGIPFMGLVGLIGECLCAASVAMGTLAVHRDDDATAPASQSEAYEGDKADHV